MKYDHIVVGGGSSGAVLATRLSEDPGRTVLLIEAGPSFNSIDSLPADVKDPFSVSVEEHDWHYRAEVAPGRMIDYARGKVIGGCSSINGTIALRGVPSDYDEWAKWGNDEWAFEKCLPYFRKIETDHDRKDQYHGADGPIDIVRFKDDELTPTQKAFTEDCMSVGLPYTEDHNHPQSQGVGAIPMNRRGALRVSSAVGYLIPALGRSNLTVQDNTIVSRVVVNGGRVRGVEVVRNGQTETIESDSVTVSAGTLNSPQILMRSGIGPEKDLKAAGVSVVHALPGVGQNLIEHQLIFVGLVPKPGVATSDLPDVQNVVSYTAPQSTEFDDMQIYMINKFGKERGGELMSGANNLPDFILAVMSVLNRPHSKGNLTIHSTDVSQQPEIRINSYSDGADMLRMVDGVRFCWRIAHSKQLQSLSTATAFPDPETIDDDQRLKTYIYDHSATIWHPVGTCKMGPTKDNMAVVDQYFHVHGVEGLRVCDASVLPNTTSRNPNLTCFVFGERLAEWLKAGK